MMIMLVNEVGGYVFPVPSIKLPYIILCIGCRSAFAPATKGYDAAGLFIQCSAIATP